MTTSSESQAGRAEVDTFDTSLVLRLFPHARRKTSKRHTENQLRISDVFTEKCSTESLFGVVAGCSQQTTFVILYLRVWHSACGSLFICNIH